MELLLDISLKDIKYKISRNICNKRYFSLCQKFILQICWQSAAQFPNTLVIIKFETTVNFSTSFVKPCGQRRAGYF